MIPSVWDSTNTQAAFPYSVLKQNHLNEAIKDRDINVFILVIPSFTSTGLLL